MKITCPVCQRTMQQASNPNIHTCPPRKIRFRELDLVLEYSHASIFLEGDVPIYQLICSGIYSFEIFSEKGNEKTHIRVLKKIEKGPWDHSTNKQFE
jgi:hypothetical protein